MANTGSVRGSGKTAVRNKRHFRAKALPHNIGSGSQHFLHAGAALGSFIAYDNHIAGLHLPGKDAFAGLFLRLDEL